MYNTTGLAAVIMVGVLIGITLLALIYVASSLILSRIFKKAGLPGWKAWVPYYNYWVFFELGGYHGALSLIILLPNILSAYSRIAQSSELTALLEWTSLIAWFVISCFVANEISKKLNKSELFILYPLGITTLGITTLIWYIKMGSSDSVWNDSLGKPSLAKGTILGYATETVYIETAQPAAPTAETPASEAIFESSNDQNKF